MPAQKLWRSNKSAAMDAAPPAAFPVITIIDDNLPARIHTK
jgi:hypothetical protein